LRDEDLLELMQEAARRTAQVLHELEDRRPTTEVAGQYALDVATDAVVVPFLVDAGLGVLSEETGLHHPEREIVVVVDPVDGSTNASRHIPWCASSLCAVDADGPRVASVVNLATGEAFDAIRGGGARCDGKPILPSSVTEIDDAILIFNGVPTHHWGWAQGRILGAAALDLCSVAAGRVDGYTDLAGNLGPWDYMGALLVCREVGIELVDAEGRELVVLEHGARRSPQAAATPELLATILVHRADSGAHP
jgi:fructose-1,6-bisphosphatase/inositol monophosphatase family enzyme